MVNSNCQLYFKKMNERTIESVVRENIRAFRKRLGWSQELLAEKTGVSAPYITQIEVGKRTPSLDIVEKLALAFGVEYKALFEVCGTDGTAGSDFSKYAFESKLVLAVTDTIHNAFKEE